MKQDKVNLFTYVVSFFIAYELDTWSQDLSADFTLKYCLFGAVKLTKNIDPNKYTYSKYGVGFDCRSFFSYPNFDWGEMLLFLE